MTDNPRQALVGHIGGTFISLAIADIDELTVAHFALLSSADFSTPMDAIERYLRSIPRCPDKVGLAVAGTVEGDVARMTYQPWTLERAAIGRLTGASRIVLVPDLEAVARALPHLSAYDVVTVHPGTGRARAPRSLVAVGTGLSVAALYPVTGGWQVAPALGGSMSLPLASLDEIGLRRRLSEDALPSVDAVLSGDGLSALCAALAEAAGKPVGDVSPPRIVRAGTSGEDVVAVEALIHFARWLGRFAGDVALLHGATGGVYLGGVIAPNIASVLAGPDFRDAFEGTGTRRQLLSGIPVDVIKTAADAGLRGAALAVAHALSEDAGA